MSEVERWAREEREALSSAGLLRSLTPHQGRQGPTLVVHGRAHVNFSSNDYLALASHPKLVQAAHEGLERFGVGAGASRLVTGDTEPLQALEAALAHFEGFPSALAFGSGWAANTGLLPALAGPQDVIFSDELNHASIVDGCRASKAKVVVYPHRDVEALEAALRSTSGRRRLVVSDTVFSMEGDLAPLQALRKLCDAHGAALVVDEAHATGVLGPRGRGACEAQGVAPDVLVGTLSKALGVVGAYVCSPTALRELLITRARPLVFSTALPPALALAAKAALALIDEEPGRRAALFANVQRLAGGLEALGWPANRETPITSLRLDSPARAMAASEALARAGYWVRPIRPPTVPEGTSRLRLAVTAAHAAEQIDGLLMALRSV